MCPPTHLIATVEDLPDMLDYAYEEADDMDDDEEATTRMDITPPITGRWAAASTYDIFMVDTPKDDGDNTNGDVTPRRDCNNLGEEPPKCRR